MEAQNSIDAYIVVRVFAVRKRLTTQNRQPISLGPGKFRTNQTVDHYAAVHQKDKIYYFLLQISYLG